MPAHSLDEIRGQVERFRRGWAKDGVSQWAAVDP